jgi:hypothetical protein
MRVFKIRNLILIIYFSGLLSPVFALASGVWFWEPYKIDEVSKKGLHAEFIIARVGTFNDSGEVKLIQNSWSNACKGRAGSSIWLSHKIKKGTALTIESGRKLASNINKLFYESCFDRIELDVEPIFKIESWHINFFTSVRKHLHKRFKLDVAIEPPSSRILPNDDDWKKDDVQKVLNVVDGVDVMNYDTGYKASEDYRGLIQSSATILTELLLVNLKKQIRFGLPAYQDKTKLHDAKIENIQSVLQLLKDLQIGKRLCTRNFQFVYFEGGDMRSEDIQWSHQLDKWHQTNCKLAE